MLEYAVVLPPLLLLIIGIVEYDALIGATAMLDGAITYASRLGKTGYDNTTATGTCPSPAVGGVITPQTQAQFINCIVGSRVNGFLDTTKLQIFATDYGSGFSAADQPVTCTNTVSTPQTIPLCSTENLGNAGDVVVYTVTYPWQVNTPLLQHFLGSNGVVTISASALVKNEPYNVTP